MCQLANCCNCDFRALLEDSSSHISNLCYGKCSYVQGSHDARVNAVCVTQICSEAPRKFPAATIMVVIVVSLFPLHHV